VVGVAQNGERALQVVDETKPAAAIVDVRMPGIDGVETAKRLWNEHRIPSVMLTAYGAEEFVRRAADVPVFGYVLKPPSPENLRAALTVGWANAMQLLDGDAEIANLRRTLDHRKLTERAKWRLVERTGMSEPEAHLSLQRAARSTRRSLAEIAQHIIDSEDPMEALRVPAS